MDYMVAKYLVLGARLVFAVCVVLVVWGAFAPPHALQPHLFPWDKAQHFCAYFALTASALLAFPRAPVAKIAVLLSLSGAAIEFIQAIPAVGRDADVWDWAADTLAIGAVMGVVLAAKLRRFAEERP